LPFYKEEKMTVSLQVFYPTENNTTFDHAYYDTKHIAIVDEHMTPHTESVQIVKGLAGGPDVPAGFHTVATMIFKDQAALDSALAAAGPALDDIPEFFQWATADADWESARINAGRVGPQSCEYTAATAKPEIFHEL
jgi:uncharacterized protein (TIGR02118 family)